MTSPGEHWSSCPTPGRCSAWRDWAIKLHPAGRQFMCSETDISKHSKAGTLRALHGTNRRFPQRDTHKRQTSLIPAENSPMSSKIYFRRQRINMFNLLYAEFETADHNGRAG